MAEIRRLSARRAMLGGIVAIFALFTLGARCVENTQVYVDEEGYTHIVGEMFNETEIQGTAIMLRGTLLDAQGNVIATKDAPTCPPDSQPGSQAVFDIQFDNPIAQQAASHRVQAIGGRTERDLLPDPKVQVLSQLAYRFIDVGPDDAPLEPGDAFFVFGLRNQSSTDYLGLQACAAAYDNKGAVVGAWSDMLFEFDEEGLPWPAALHRTHREDVFIMLSDVPDSAIQVRGWVWIGFSEDSTSQYRFMMTPKITFQTKSLGN